MKSCIILGAGKPKHHEYPGVSDLLIPLNGIPVLNYILDSLEVHKIDEYVFVVQDKDFSVRKYIDFVMKKKNIQFKVLLVEGSLGPGNSVLEGLLAINKQSQSVIINLGDTIIFNQECIEGSYIVTSKNRFSLPVQTWAYVDENKIIDKPKTISENYQVVTGLYTIAISDNFFEKITRFSRTEFLEISCILNNCGIHFSTIDKTNDWIDCGNPLLFHKAKVSQFKLRFFNSLEYDDFRGVLTKKSTNLTKLQNEVNWFLQIPEELKPFTPRLISYTKDSYSLEYYTYPTLSDLYLFGNLEIHMWEDIFTKLFDFLDYALSKCPMKLESEDYEHMFVSKTLQRIDYSVMRFETIIIDGIEYVNPLTNINSSYLHTIAQELFSVKRACVIHGDMCFSNILYNVNSQLFKLIDPRGEFGSSSLGGEQLYDLAKLRHSVCGKYDYIVSDLFILEQKGNSFERTFVSHHTQIIELFDTMIVERGFSLDLIKKIEMLLFLSMIPLHKDSPDRQKMMFLRFVELYWEIENENCN